MMIQKKENPDLSQNYFLEKTVCYMRDYLKSEDIKLQGIILRGMCALFSYRYGVEAYLGNTDPLKSFKIVSEWNTKENPTQLIKKALEDAIRMFSSFYDLIEKEGKNLVNQTKDLQLEIITRLFLTQFEPDRIISFAGHFPQELFEKDSLLAKFLLEIDSKENVLLMLFVHDHACALQFKDNKWVFYDPNNEDEIVFDTKGELVSYIHEHLNEDNLYIRYLIPKNSNVNQKKFDDMISDYNQLFNDHEKLKELIEGTGLVMIARADHPPAGVEAVDKIFIAAKQDKTVLKVLLESLQNSSAIEFLCAYHTKTLTDFINHLIESRNQVALDTIANLFVGKTDYPPLFVFLSYSPKNFNQCLLYAQKNHNLAEKLLAGLNKALEVDDGHTGLQQICLVSKPGNYTLIDTLCLLVGKFTDLKSNLGELIKLQNMTNNQNGLHTIALLCPEKISDLLKIADNAMLDNIVLALADVEKDNQSTVLHILSKGGYSQQLSEIFKRALFDNRFIKAIEQCLTSQDKSGNTFIHHIVAQNNAALLKELFIIAQENKQLLKLLIQSVETLPNKHNQTALNFIKSNEGMNNLYQRFKSSNEKKHNYKELKKSNDNIERKVKIQETNDDNEDDIFTDEMFEKEEGGKQERKVKIQETNDDNEDDIFTDEMFEKEEGGKQNKFTDNVERKVKIQETNDDNEDDIFTDEMFEKNEGNKQNSRRELFTEFVEKITRNNQEETNTKKTLN